MNAVLFDRGQRFQRDVKVCFFMSTHTHTYMERERGGDRTWL